MSYCPYCNTFKPSTRCQVPKCGGNVCEGCGQCNRQERFHPKEAPDANAALTR